MYIMVNQYFKEIELSEDKLDIQKYLKMLYENANEITSCSIDLYYDELAHTRKEVFVCKITVNHICNCEYNRIYHFRSNSLVESIKDASLFVLFHLKRIYQNKP
jgi:hypothetical protein